MVCGTSYAAIDNGENAFFNYREGGSEAVHTHLEWTKVHIHGHALGLSILTPFPSVTG